MHRVYYYSESNNIYFNLALEEYFVRNFDFSNQELLLIYRNDPCIVLGKNQNFFQEVHLSSFFKSNYNLARRISGGGTVVHDLGNINFAFFEKHDLKRVNQYSSSVGKITQVLNELNIQSSMNERNAIILDNGKKVSGSAQFSSNKAILSHLTLLFNSNLELIDQLIQKNPYSLETKASPSVRSVIDNVSNYTNLKQEEFIQKSLSLLGFENKLDLDLITKAEVEKLMEQKYSQSSFYFETAANGRITYSNIELEIDKGRISKIEGIAESYRYLDKLLFPSELSLEDPIWNLLFKAYF
jgi:lipoate-protein ligase A